MSDVKPVVVVIFGGESSEYEVSLSSASCVLENLDFLKYDVKLIGVTKRGEFYLYEGGISLIKRGEWETEGVYPVSLDLVRGCFCARRGGEVLEIRPDVVFPVVHGRFCEDGTLQGMLELAHMPFIGSGSTSSAACMDKAITKAVVSTYTNVKQAKSIVARAGDDVLAIREKCEARFGYPMFIKPARAGSSVGVTKVKSADEFEAAVAVALHEDGKYIIEECIVGREVEVAVFENHGEYFAAHAAEIISSNAEIYDYNAKYNSDTSTYRLPADIPAVKMDEIRKQALEVFKAMDCRSLSRVDFFYTDGGELVFNEINTLPGFTTISMYPKMMMAEGMSYAELVEKLIGTAHE